MKSIFIALVCIFNLFLRPAYAEMHSLSPNSFVENSYIVQFKDPVGDESRIIWKTDFDRTKNRGQVPFGEHSTGQSKEDLAKELGISGKVNRIYESINAVHIFMDAGDLKRLSQDKRVKSITQEAILGLTGVQTNPGWALDRLDQTSTTLDNQYVYSNTGAGRTIYILDSGLTLTNPNVATEFGGRASVFFDFNGGDGNDCNGHGTMVASVAGGNTRGIAKGVTLRMVKITGTDCGYGNLETRSIDAFNWFAIPGNVPHGTIVNYSNGFWYANGCGQFISTALDGAIASAHNAGVIVVVAAANDGCNTANYSPTSIPEAFVVGATSNLRLSVGQDAKASFSRTGTNISAFAPGEQVSAMTIDGTTPSNINGTSFSAPYIAGIFAVVCQAVGTYCDTAPTADIYSAFRSTAILNTVTNIDGTPLTGATPRFIRQQW